MGKEKSTFKKETITVQKGDIDPGLKRTFRTLCKIRGVRFGEMLAEVMEKKIRDTYGPGADRILDDSRKYVARLADKTLDLS